MTADNYPVPGVEYRHYKGDTVRVVAVGAMEATGQPCVVYTHNGTVWVRLVSAWLEDVCGPAGAGRVPRFARVSLTGGVT
jgi:hypothetical protein